MASSRRLQQGESSGSGSKNTVVERRAEAEQLHAAALRGRYALQSLRGWGSFGDVWEARHRRTGLKVAIKIISAAKLQEKKVPLRKVEREVRVMRLLSRHPHIIRFHEAFAGGGHVYIVMELAVQGLDDYLSTWTRNKVPEAEARRMFQQVASGVAYCHHNMVVHRDLKAENLLMDARGDVKIVDFGFSKFFRHNKLLGSCCGSLEYAAPELHEHGRYIGPQVDVWSCGVILYVMLCGHLPFDDADRSQLKRIIRRGEFRLPATVSDGARDLICSMLIVKPDKRLTMAEVTTHPWLQPGVPAYLALPPLDANTHPFMQIDDETVQLVVAQHGFSRRILLDSLHRGIDDEATVTYDLMLSRRIDATTRYLWTILGPRQAAARAGQSGSAAMDAASDMLLPLPGGGEGTGEAARRGQGQGSSRRPWSLAGVGALRECPRETMRHVAQALRELGVHFHYSCSRHQQQPPGHRSHRMVCVHFPGAVPGAAAISNFLLLTSNDSQPEPIGGDAAATAAASSSSSSGQTTNSDILETLSAAVFLEIQLYRAGEGEGSEYVLDLRRMSGPQLPYLRICSQLASRLRAAAH